MFCTGKTQNKLTPDRLICFGPTLSLPTSQLFFDLPILASKERLSAEVHFHVSREGEGEKI